jgi:PP-loop superfamily ATP-utilizing enzyme
LRKRYETSKGVTYNLDLVRARQKAQAKGITQEIPTENQNQQIEHKEEATAKVCWICGKQILEQFEQWAYDASTGKPCHVECLRKVKEGLRHD